MTKLPDVSFAIANFNGGQFLVESIRSALDQRGVSVELIIVDDCSTDDSWALAQQLADTDPRIRTFRLPDNRGPGGARNRALAEARGTWFAILDNDDLIHPDRSRRLLDEAGRSDATMIADDLLLFDQDGAQPPRLFLKGARARDAQWIDLRGYLRETVMYGRSPNLGFLKPMIRTDFLRSADIRYDERLRIAEDDDLIIRLLLAGARYRLLPYPMYFYRKHGRSISHRLSPAHAERMLAAADRQHAAIAAQRPDVLPVFARRQRALRQAGGFSHLVDALKRRDTVAAIRVALKVPSSLLLLHQPIRAALGRRLRHTPADAPAASTGDSDGVVLFVSRQRLVGATNGSSAYLLSLAEAARTAGFVPHLLQPSPGLFGRTPFFRLRPEMRVFAEHHIRGAWRIGDRVIAHDPAIAIAAVRGVLARILRKAGVGGPLSVDRKAPYAIAAPWSRADLLYLARHGRGTAKTVIADYIFQTEALPYLLTPGLRSATVMHDLFSARAGQFGDGATDSVSAIDEAKEIDLLGRSDAVIAIQNHEAAFVRDRVAQTQAILAPMAATPADVPAPGNADTLLFVGSNTAPNVHGLAWFLSDVWPRVRAQRPDSRLLVAGRVAEAIIELPAGVEMLGLVDDLKPLYIRAGIVISPLRQGSGLKIKLIEAIAMGKACVVTAVTLQGVEGALADAVSRADDAEAFAAAISDLQNDEDRRCALAAAALAAAREHFGPAAAHAAFRAWLGQPQALGH